MPMMPMNGPDDDQPREITIKKADGGFIITKHGGDTSFHETPTVTDKDGLDDVLVKFKKWLLK